MAADRDQYDREEIYSKVIRAGKRTYFFDVKSTRGNDLYLTVTESKKHFDDSGEARYEKHKIFLYKEDFDKFQEGLEDALSEIQRLKSSEERFKEAPSSEQDAGQGESSYTHTEW